MFEVDVSSEFEVNPVTYSIRLLTRATESMWRWTAFALCVSSQFTQHRRQIEFLILATYVVEVNLLLAVHAVYSLVTLSGGVLRGVFKGRLQAQSLHC
jgi:hypothetical protein